MSFHLAQLNIAKLVAPLDSPALTDFVALLPTINALGEASPGFVWRLRDEDVSEGEVGDATTFRPFGEDHIVNLTVWESVEALREYTYRSGHLEPLRRRREWFVPHQGPHLVLWWIPAGHIPTLDEAAERLKHLADHGTGPDAFTLREPYSAPEIASR